jgi:hypothetical protein
MVPRRSLRFLDLSVVLIEEHVTEFESLDMAIHMLFLAGKHSLSTPERKCIGGPA